MWLQINSFWEVIATKDVIFGGIIYEELSELVLTFPIMVPRNESALYMYADLQHVNNFIETINGKFVLIKAII